MGVKAIETRYNGYRFRSRLEARWAVFFDAADIEYIYEPEGFVTETGEKYLPDFFLPNLTRKGCYVEVKPEDPKRLPEIVRAARVICHDTTNQLLLFGTIPNITDCGIWVFPMFGYDSISEEVKVRMVPLMSQGFEFWVASNIHLVRDGESHSKSGNLAQVENWSFDIRSMSCADYEGCDEDTYPFWSGIMDDERDFVKKCFDEAKSARFEHGDKPKIHPVANEMAVNIYA